MSEIKIDNITIDTIDIRQYDNDCHWGIYAWIIDKKEIVYIGKTNSFLNRLLQHEKGLKEQKEWKYQELKKLLDEGHKVRMVILRDMAKEEEESNVSFSSYPRKWMCGEGTQPPHKGRELCLMEAMYIQLLKPRLNLQGVTKPYPLPTDEMVEKQKENYKKMLCQEEIKNG